MEDTLSRFVDKTGCDPSFARDLLEGKKWDFDEAVKAFKEFSLEPEENQTKTRIVNKPRRGISVVNSDIVFKARTKVLEGDSPANGNQFDTYKDTFILPDLSAFPQDFGDFLRKDLIETSALVALEQSGHLNWWADIGVCQRLVPLATVGDGNCLLHAASLGFQTLQGRKHNRGKKDVSQAEKGPGDTDKKVKKGEPKMEKERKYRG
ncbi:hypothetical protein QZH41_011115 [Actinostola sp. cb2023]|nr:hypothetical protein QZH41_011115 [Actinostola sp. cb2023]